MNETIWAKVKPLRGWEWKAFTEEQFQSFPKEKVSVAYRGSPEQVEEASRLRAYSQSLKHKELLAKMEKIMEAKKD